MQFKSIQIKWNIWYNIRHTQEIKHANQLSAVHYIDNNYIDNQTNKPIRTNKHNIVTSNNIHRTNGAQQGRTNSPCKDQQWKTSQCDGCHFVTAWCCSVSNQWRHTVTNKSTYWSVYFVISITFYNSYKINVTMWWFSTSQCDVLKGTTNQFSSPCDVSKGTSNIFSSQCDVFAY